MPPDAILLASERYNSSDPVNLGSGEEISIKELAGKVAAAAGFTGRIAWDTSKPNGQPRRKLDTTRAEERFGFRAHTTFDDGHSAHSRLVPEAARCGGIVMSADLAPWKTLERTRLFSAGPITEIAQEKVLLRTAVSCRTTTPRRWATTRWSTP